MRPLMRGLRKTGDFLLKKQTGRKADIALVVSEQSLNYLAYERKYVRTGGRRQNYNHTGAVGNFTEGALRLTGPLIAGRSIPSAGAEPYAITCLPRISRIIWMTTSSGFLRTVSAMTMHFLLR